MADSDLDQYDGTPSFVQDLLSALFLVPRDGKKETANNNATGKAPVNRALKQAKDLMIGMHDGIFGSRPGSQLKTVRALEASDTSPGTDTTAADGEVKASKDLHTTGGDVLADDAGAKCRVGVAADQRTYQTNAAFEFWTTADASGTDANPPAGQPQTNRLCAKNTPKVWASITTDGMGGYDIHDGYNISTLTLDSGTKTIKYTFAAEMGNFDYAVTIGGSDAGDADNLLKAHWVRADKTITDFTLHLKNDPTAEIMHIDLELLGRQDSV